jgi:sugar lactone lactonase YvrE
MTTTPDIDVVLHAGAILGEGPVWVDGSLWWVDIEGHRFHRTNPETGEDALARTDGPIGSVIPRTDGGWVAGMSDGISFLTSKGTEEHHIPIESANAGSRMNDAKCDPAGRLFIGTMTNTGRRSSLYRVDTNWAVSTMLTGIGISNGLGWSPDAAHMYYIDSPTMRVDVIDFDLATGAIEHRRPLIDVGEGEGLPDGMTVDADGCLWVAFWDGWCVRCYDPEGHLVRTVELPVSRVTSCTFGGSELDQLFITSASIGLSAAERESQPLAGAVFRADVGVRGRPADYYAA